MFKRWIFISCLSVFTTSFELLAANESAQTIPQAVSDFVKNTQDISAIFDSGDLNGYSPWYKNSYFRLIFGVTAAGLTQMIIIQPALDKMAASLLILSNRMTNCDNNDPLLKENCSNSMWIFRGTTTSLCICLSYLYTPFKNWVANKTMVAYEKASTHLVRKELEKRSRALEAKVKTHLVEQKNIISTLLSLDLQKLDLALRKAVYLNAAVVGNLALMKGVLHPAEDRELLEYLERIEQETCSICRENLFSDAEKAIEINDCAIKTSCGHHFHKRCFLAWRIKGSGLCPNCRAKDFTSTFIFESWVLLPGVSGILNGSLAH